MLPERDGSNAQIITLPDNLDGAEPATADPSENAQPPIDPPRIGGGDNVVRPPIAPTPQPVQPAPNEGLVRTPNVRETIVPPKRRNPLMNNFSASTRNGEPVRTSPAPAPAPRDVPTVAPLTAPPQPTPQPMVVEQPIEKRATTVIEQNDEYALVRVFYGTDRQRITTEEAAGGMFNVAALAAAGLVTLFLGLALWSAMNKRFVRCGGAVVAALIGMFVARALIEPPPRRTASGEAGVTYGDERGALEYGTCDITIPKNHQVGELESPSILRLEFAPDEKKHVVVKDVVPYEADTFFGKLRDVVTKSPKRDIFVFVHGYNVTFENAARRTAQMAYDLEFQGAPIFYSWPSQGGLLSYTVDETNAAWTVPHLKQFLLRVARDSNADAVNLIAHSMGNRALTSALRELRLELREDAAMFNQVVLAAPDIDAEVFRRDIAPAIVQSAQRVTLYASSDDQALVASRKVHGYARAGDSGDGLVVIPGIETIDVSGIDTSLLGHSYYGGSGSILQDLYHVIHDYMPASQRQWLEQATRNGLSYWRFRAEAISAALPPAPASR